MSYDRSPRAVCSTTIGTKFSALVSKCLLLSGQPWLGAHEILEAHALRGGGRACQQELHHLIFENRSLDLSHHATIAAVELCSFIGFFVRCRELLDALLDAGLVEFDLVFLQKFLDQ